jgi:hypothetical protein
MAVYMSKNAKKKPANKSVKKTAKAIAKPAAKSLKSGAKSAAKKASAKAPKMTAKASPAKVSAKTETKSLTKTVASVVGKLFAKDKAPTKASPVPLKKEKLGKKAKGKGKKKDMKDGSGFEEDLLASDEEIGSEDIPDLSEFDENEVEEVESTEIEIETEIEVKPVDDEIYLTDAEGRRYCRVKDCDQISAVEGYCRYHYLLLWKRIQVRRKILVDGKLERYVEELTSRYPDKFLEMIRKDLRSEKDFVGAIAELEIDESANENEMEDETQSFIDEVRGITTDTGTITDDDDGF